MKNTKINNALKYICTALIVFVMTFFACACGGNNLNHDDSSQDKTPPAWASNFNLPDADSVLEKLNNIYGGADKVFLLREGKIARMPCPRGEIITVNVTIDVGEYTKLILEDSIAEFNEVFSAINPNYNFAINYSPTDENLKNKYSIKLSVSNSLSSTETSQTLG